MEDKAALESCVENSKKNVVAQTTELEHRLRLSDALIDLADDLVRPIKLARENWHDLIMACTDEARRQRLIEARNRLPISAAYIIGQLPIKDHKWILSLAAKKYEQFVVKYTSIPQDRSYYLQQEAEQLASAVGFKMTIDNKGDNTYEIYVTLISNRPTNIEANLAGIRGRTPLPPPNPAGIRGVVSRGISLISSFFRIK
jgi:hypothetical protein